jgi:hypothetical protein
VDKETQIGVRMGLCVLLIVLNAVTLYGGYCLKTLQNRPLAMTAIVLSIVPCTSACYSVGIILGIWALV